MAHSKVPINGMASLNLGGSGGEPLAMLPGEDERELLGKGTQGVASAVAREPILGSYLPVHPVNRYTYKKWDTGDWARHNENKYFQSSRDRDASRL